MHKWVIDIHDDDYQRYKNFACVYCGNTTGKTRDHVISVDWTGHGRHYSKGDTVSACTECNSLLSNIPLFCIASRANYLASRLGEKYRKILNQPRWTKEELKELSYELNIKISAADELKKFIAARIAHCTYTALETIKKDSVKQLYHDDMVILKILDDCKRGHKYIEIEKKHNLESGQISKILSQKKYTNLFITFKYQNNIPFDMCLRKYFKMIRDKIKKETQKKTINFNWENVFEFISKRNKDIKLKPLKKTKINYVNLKNDVLLNLILSKAHEKSWECLHFKTNFVK